MPAPPDGDITCLLHRVSAGDNSAESDLMEHVYRDLHRLAASYLRGERQGHTLQPTALVNEAYLKLVGSSVPEFQNRNHFFRLAAIVMRRILVDHARVKRAKKRGGDVVRVPFEDIVLGILPEQFEVILDLDQALQRLNDLDSRQAQVVEMRFFGGLSEDEIASALGVSTRTVKREWTVAKAWLHAEMCA